MIQTTILTTYTNTTIAILLQNCKSLNQLKQIHAHLLKIHLPENPVAIGPILSMAATSNNSSFFSYARSIFQNLSFRNTFMYNTMIRGNVQTNSPASAILCYIDMLDYGLQPNNYTYPPLIKACSIQTLPMSKEVNCLVHAHVVKFGFCHDPFVGSALIEFYSINFDMGRARMLFDEMPDRDVVLWTVMIDGYGKTGDIGTARSLFEDMPVKNVISWSTMMSAYSRVNDYNEVLRLFSLMQEQGIKPNESVLVSVLTAGAHIGALAQGLWVHSYARRHKLDSNPILATALVDMYAKCGYLELALSVFEGIANKDLGAWNAIIAGVALNGDVRKSIELFAEMVLNGAQPNETTFVAVLTSCTHAQLVKEGLELFEKMGSVYGIEPRYEHYACVVDLLARAGKLDEAENFIEEKMGGIGEGDANMWGALLGACKVYGNVEVGDRVWKKLANVGVSDSGIHVLTYNIYKEGGWENEAKGVRKMITESGIKKTPGCSIIEVDGVVEEFVAGDLFHPRGQEICKMLDSFFKVVNNVL